MTAAPFVASLRARSGTIRMSAAGAPGITIRAQLAEAWDAVRIEVGVNESVAAVKACALEALEPGAGAADYVATIRGTEILDEGVSLDAAGIGNGATLLIAHRRRRPVR
jgi:hypothetical protein